MRTKMFYTLHTALQWTTSPTRNCDKMREKNRPDPCASFNLGCYCCSSETGGTSFDCQWWHSNVATGMVRDEDPNRSPVDLSCTEKNPKLYPFLKLLWQHRPWSKKDKIIFQPLIFRGYVPLVRVNLSWWTRAKKTLNQWWIGRGTPA